MKMICQSCGTANQENASICKGCGQTLTAPIEIPGQSYINQNTVTDPQAFSVLPQTPNTAGFGKRFGAFLLDIIIMMIAGAIIGGIVGVFLGIVMVSSGATSESINSVSRIVGQVLGIALNWLYYALLESSWHQATFGKRALGIMVTDSNNQRISFGRATARFFGKFLISGGLTLGIGFLFAAFGAKKQALHDMMAGTLVVNK